MAIRFTKNFPQDGSEMFRKFDEGIKRRAILSKRVNFRHKTRGLSKFKKELADAIGAGKNDDYVFNGEDEVRIEYFDEDMALTAVLDVLKRRGLLKHIK